MGGNGFAQMSHDGALSEFAVAGIAYKEGRYDEAVVRYNKILKGGQTSGIIHYNLGNSYFKRGKIGKAILNYERARRSIPRDSDLNFNYEFVRSKADSYGYAGKSKIFDQLIQSHIQFYTIDEMVVILVGIAIIIGILFLVSLYVHWPETLRGGVLIILVLIFLVYGIGLIIKVDGERDLAIVMTSTESFFEPRTDSTVHFKLHEGSKAKILKSEGHWIKIQRLDKKIGWVDRDVLEKI